MVALSTTTGEVQPEPNHHDTFRSTPPDAFCCGHATTARSPRMLVTRSSALLTHTLRVEFSSNTAGLQLLLVTL